MRRAISWLADDRLVAIGLGGALAAAAGSRRGPAGVHQKPQADKKAIVANT
jgi:hypothetical protein